VDTKRTIVLIVVASLLFAALGFAAGTYYQRSQSPGRGDMANRAMGGPMAEISDEDRAAIESMTEEERQAYFEENFGGQMPGAAGDSGGPPRGGTLEGEVLEVASGTITLGLENGGSQTVYTDGDTVVANADGAAELAVGSEVIVIAQPQTDGVAHASVVVVR
jgi:hypothetical protein